MAEVVLLNDNTWTTDYGTRQTMIVQAQRRFWLIGFAAALRQRSIVIANLEG